jgi:trk system potassium uptake protein TrkH
MNGIDPTIPGGKTWQAVQPRSPLKTALYMIGLLLILFSVTMLPPMAVAWHYDGYHVVMPFAEAMAAMLGLGLLCWLPVCRLQG